MEEKFVNENLSAETLRRIVKRSRQDSFFMGWAIAQYQASHRLNDRELAAWLECSPKTLGRLALCRLPDDQTDRFQTDVRQIAEFARCHPGRLIELVREVAAVSSLREPATAAEAGLLLAARDRKSRKKAKEDEH